MLKVLPWLVIAAVMLVSVLVDTPDGSADPVQEYTYSDFLKMVDAGRIATFDVSPDGTASGDMADGGAYTTRVPVEFAGESVLARLEDAGVEIEAVDNESSVVGALLGWAFTLLPFALIIGFWVYLGRRSGGALGGQLTMGRSKAKVFDTERPTTTFADVAGYDEVKREIMEIADFVRQPERYRRSGASAPRGVLMTGPPGTGKTLLARALAGEVGVPFLSVTGSSFVEMFVGVGAARVRDLFEEARKKAPAIIFLDEIDAIGQRRRGGVFVSNDEREQTLNQLLVEMDGFDPSVGIIVLAATNRPEVLDAALLRPGRFDRQVVIPLPNQEERRAILEVHCRDKHLAQQVDLVQVARGTPGFSGADLANLVNEAAIRAARDEREAITVADLDEAWDRILLGLRGGSNVLLPEERKAVAVHEAGHALVAAHCSAADPVHRVTILPSGQTLGVTRQLPEQERHLYSERYLYDTLAVQLGGRAAELEVFGRGSTGAANDLAMATAIATRMVKEYGLSIELGPVAYPSSGPMFLTDDSMVESRPYADATQRLIDEAVARILGEAQERAVAIVSTHRAQLDALSDRLVIEETIDGRVVYEIAGCDVPSTRPQILAMSQDPDARAVPGADPPSA